MALVTKESVLAHTLITDDDHALKVLDFAPQAEERMRDVLTEEVERNPQIFRWFDEEVKWFDERNRGDIYDAIVDQDSPWEKDDKDRLRHAETLFAFAEALPVLNIKLLEDGGIAQSTGWDRSRTQYRSERQSALTQVGLRSQAVRLARGLLHRHDRDDPNSAYVL